MPEEGFLERFCVKHASVQTMTSDTSLPPKQTGHRSRSHGEARTVLERSAGGWLKEGAAWGKAEEGVEDEELESE